MILCRIGAIRSGVRKPKPRRNAPAANSRPVLFPQLGTQFAFLILAFWSAAQQTSLAQSGVAFDVPATVACVPVEIVPPNHVAANTNGLLAVQTISQATKTTRAYLVSFDVNAVFAEPQQFQSVMFEIMPLSRNAQIIDYAPQTQATSDWAGEISSESVATKNMQFNANLNAAVPGYGSGGLLYNSTNNENTVSRQSFKAPLTAVVTSGLSQRGRGVFFRFTTSRESIIEGGQKLQLIVEVPATWRGDLFHVHCVARNSEQTIHRDFLTAVTILGDEATRAVAETFASADYETDQVIRRTHIAQRPTSVFSELENALSRRTTGPEMVDLTRVRQALLAVHATQQVPQFQQLPQRLQNSIANYLQAKQAMLELARSEE
ncbi:MAG: hypothetical protein JNL67_23260 [Planctomycetaceae bacterium]|nr:hypothetical protein [Planctomycetaceae bacterium]